MNKNIILAGKILTGAGTLVCAAWAYYQPDFEPVAATLGSMAAFIALFVVESNSKPKPPAMRQRGGKGSTNYQSGGNMTVNPKPRP